MIAPNHIEVLEIGYLLYELSSFFLTSVSCNVFSVRQKIHERGVFLGLELEWAVTMCAIIVTSVCSKNTISPSHTNAFDISSPV